MREGTRALLVAAIAAAVAAGCGSDFPRAYETGAELASAPADATWLRVRGIRDEDVAILGRFRHVTHLDLFGGFRVVPQRMSAAGLVRYAAVAPPSLENVRIAHSDAIDDAAIHALASLPRLRHIGVLGCTRFDPASLASLRSIPGLESLDLRLCKQVRDEHAKVLAELRSLRRLLLGGTSLSIEAIDWLSAAMPECAIDVTRADGFR